MLCNHNAVLDKLKGEELCSVLPWRRIARIPSLKSFLRDNHEAVSEEW